jgi:hypothetical protein
MQLQPSLATELTEDSSSTDTKFQLNDKFHLINVVFLEDLSGLAMKSEETVSFLDLNAGLLVTNPLLGDWLNHVLMIDFLQVM